jgi:uncharacterized protein (DUF4415 family)
MNNNSDPLFNQYADMDFSDAKPVHEIPALAKLQAQYGNKSRITIRIDNDTLAFFQNAGRNTSQQLSVPYQ